MNMLAPKINKRSASERSRWRVQNPRCSEKIFRSIFSARLSGPGTIIVNRERNPDTKSSSLSKRSRFIITVHHHDSHLKTLPLPTSRRDYLVKWNVVNSTAFQLVFDWIV